MKRQHLYKLLNYIIKYKYWKGHHIYMKIKEK